MKKVFLISAIFLILFVSGCTQTPPTNTQQDNTGTTGDSTQKTFSLSEVALHNSREDCWLAIHGKVYDVTGFIPSHPGGEAILQGCGKDATELFESRPMGTGTPHSEAARNLRENYFIGNLK